MNQPSDAEDAYQFLIGNVRRTASLAVHTGVWYQFLIGNVRPYFEASLTSEYTVSPHIRPCGSAPEWRRSGYFPTFPASAGG